MRSLMGFVVAAATMAACGQSESTRSAKPSFRQMHETAVASRDKGASLEAAARPFVGMAVELDVVAGEAQGGVCAKCFEMTFEDIKILVVPDRDLDPIKFAIFVEQHQGRPVRIQAVVDGGAPGFIERSPLALRVHAIAEAPSAAPAQRAASTTTGSAKPAGNARPPDSASTGPASVPTAAARQGESIELLRSTGASIVVSSTVANNAHRPEHLVDGNLSTAWNSRTGAMKGSWISIELPTKVDLTALKLTVGFTAAGPKGEDWFSMNHRISRVRIEVDRKEVGDFKLDPSRRDLQTIALATPGQTVRVEILEVTTGSKSNWKEACISELELWGRTTQPPRTNAGPVVRVDSGSRACPDNARLIQLVRSRSSFAKKNGKVAVDGCRAGRFPTGTWYVTASVTTPGPPGDPSGYGDRYLVRGVLDGQERFTVFKEDGDSSVHPTVWESVKLQDQDADGFDESVEELEGRGGVRYLKRDVFAIGATEIKSVSSKRLGEYDADGTFYPEEATP